MGKKKGTRCLRPFLKLLPGHLVCMSTPPSCRFSKFISQRELEREEMWGRSGRGEAGLIVDLGINSIDNNNKRHYSSNAKYSPNIVRDISAAFVLFLTTILKVGVTSPILSTEKNWGPEILRWLGQVHPDEQWQRKLRWRLVSPGLEDPALLGPPFWAADIFPSLLVQRVK